MLDPDDPPPPNVTAAEQEIMDRAGRIMRMQTAVVRYLTYCMLGWIALTALMLIAGVEFDAFPFLLGGVLVTMTLAFPFMTDFCFPVLKQFYPILFKAAERSDWEERERARRAYNND